MAIIPLKMLLCMNLELKYRALKTSMRRGKIPRGWEKFQDKAYYLPTIIKITERNLLKLRIIFEELYDFSDESILEDWINQNQEEEDPWSLPPVGDQIQYEC